jgi:hypothetical protein
MPSIVVLPSSSAARWDIVHPVAARSHRDQDMSMTPALVLIGLALVIVAIPVAISLGPLVLGAVLLGLGLRRAHVGLAEV